MPIGRELPQLLKECFMYKGRKLNFEVNRLRLPNKAEGEWECIRHPGGSLAVPLTSDGKLVLVRQYRFAISGRILEFPAGTVEANEDPFETVQREIEEEIGYHAQTWQKLGEFFLAPGYSDEIIYAYLAKDLQKLEHPPAREADEDMETVLMTPREFEQAIADGEQVDAKSICSFMLASPFLNI